MISLRFIAWIIEHRHGLDKDAAKIQHSRKISLPCQNDLPASEPGDELAILRRRQLECPMVLASSCWDHGNELSKGRNDASVPSPDEEEAPEGTGATSIDYGNIEGTGVCQ